MARIHVNGNVIRVSGRGADKVIKKLMASPGLNREESRRKSRAMKYPEYSEKGYERLRELGKL